MTRTRIGGFGGGWLKRSRQWLGAHSPGLSPGVSRAARSRQACPEEAQEPSWGTAKGAALWPCCWGPQRSKEDGDGLHHEQHGE
eukprot:scaffold66460_cov35-Phaeocystis_antarctica.AAC.2